MNGCLGLALLLLLATSVPAAEIIQADLVIYGATPAGVMAGVQSARMGKTAVIAEPGLHVGGMTSGGLGATDIGNKAAIGGLALEFYRRVAQHYADPGAWNFEQAEAYFQRPGVRATLQQIKQPGGTMWTFEPHVAEQLFFNLLNEHKVAVYLQQRLAQVRKEGRHITALIMENGKEYRASNFIDATYEGDLMARAGVSYTVGRESNDQYRETLNGVCAETPKHQFSVAVDPYVQAGNPASGLLPFIQSEPLGVPGQADKAVQAYNFRLCYTKVPANRLPHAPPPGYDRARYELLARYLEALVAAGKQPTLGQFWNPIWMPNGKTDINNNGGFSTDFIGSSHAYPEASWAERDKIWTAHEHYIRGFVYFLATNPRVPSLIRQEMNEWGPAADEFVDTGGWPNQLYVREARRMVSDNVMTEHNCRGETSATDPVGLAAYTMDSHNCRRIVRNGRAENEGDVQVAGFPPYPISSRSIMPKKNECENLLVPVCLSSTHISYGSIRMEPVFMILGQSAATIAALALESHVPIQEIPYEKVRSRLLADGQILERPPTGADGE